MTFSVPHIVPRLNTLLKTGVDIVGISNWNIPSEHGGSGDFGLDHRISHDRSGSRSDPILNGHLHYPNDIDKSLNETDSDKIRKYRVERGLWPPGGRHA